MELPDTSVAAPQGRWTSLWVVALVSLVAQLWLCQFFSFGENVPASIDINPSNVWKFAYQFPPAGSFQVLNWLGVAYPAQPLNPLSIATAPHAVWFFFTSYAPIISTCALLAMAAFLRELELSRPAAIFGGVVYAWQGDLLPFVYPGHYGYITSWPFFAIAAWGALRAARTGHWAYAVMSGASCGIMVGLLTNADRGSIASILIGILYLASFVRSAIQETWADALRNLGHLAICVVVAVLVALAPLLALFKGNIVGVTLGGSENREQTYELVTQFSLAPVESLTYLVPGLYGWHSNHPTGPYWGWIGQWPSWSKSHQGMANFNLAISTTGTVATVLALLAIVLLLTGRLMGPNRITSRQRLYGSVLFGAGLATLFLSWGWHTPLYRPIFDYLPLMDKWRNPLKWLEMTNFALVVLSALGAEQLLASLGPATPEVRSIRIRLAIFLGGWLLILGIGFMASYPISVIVAGALHAEGNDPGMIADTMNTMHHSALVAFLIMALLCFVLVALWEPARLSGVTVPNPWLNRIWHRMLMVENLPLTLALSVAATAMLQLGWVTTHFIDPSPLSALTQSNPLLETLREEGDRVRVSVENSDPLLNSLLQNQFSALGISCLEISAASRLPNDFSAYQQALAGLPDRAYFLAGVKNIAIPEAELAQMQAAPRMAANIAQAAGYTLVPTMSTNLPSHALVEMKDYLAKATFVPGAEYFSDDKTLLERLKAPEWNPRATILLVGKSESTPSATPAANAADGVDLKIYTPTEIEMTANSATGGYVLINDQYDPDWQAQVNGRDVPLLRADYIMRAVKIPPGDSTITMRYIGHYRVAGLPLNAVAVNLFSDGALVLAWIVAGLALRRKDVAPDRKSSAKSR